MYTQCPECGVAFRVTAEVLKIAAGKVRCGGCGVPFNALEHLSESKPIAQPEPQGPAESDPHQPSADENSSLLKALDELAGEDVRIEDTGVEWRVVGDRSEDWNDKDSEPEEEQSEQPGSEPPRAIDEMLFDDNTVLPDDFDDFVEAPSTPKPIEPLTSEEPEPEPPQIDLDLSEPDEWDELLGDLEILSSEAEPEPEPEPAPEPEPEVAELETETFGKSRDEENEDELERSIEEDLFAAAFESEAAARALRDEPGDETPDDAGEDEDHDPLAEELEIDIQVDDDLETEDDVEDIANPFDDSIEDTIATLSMSLNENLLDEDIGEEPSADAEESEEESDSEEESESGEHVIPEMTEEEKTINMLIDQDLLNIAVEDEDGFASTIVQLQPDDKVEKEIADKDSRSKKWGKKDKKDSDSDEADETAAGEPALPGMGVETIIMEGEFVRSGENGVPLALNREKDDYELRREMDGQKPRIGMYVGLAALLLVLLVQVIHQSRDALATVPAFNSAVGPVYRMLGMPLTPAWDISGWRFEATKGDTDENGQTLTIYSRVGNNSDEPLPYPLVHLSLTDRFEDVIGSTVLEPAEYLPENSDPRTLVPPGNTFNAVIAIDSPSSDATGFKLNVCYRLASGQLRCADHDFK
jgi:predicted Zn finger-like uncharacterized protein